MKKLTAMIGSLKKDKPTRDVTHSDLIKVVRLFAPAISEGGVCNGVTAMWMQAVLTGEEQEDNFYKRFDTLSKYLSKPNHTIESLKTKIDSIYASRVLKHKKTKLSPAELDTVEIRAFAESVAIQHEPAALGISTQFIPQNTKNILFPLTASAALERSTDPSAKEPARKIKSDLIGTVGLSHQELVKYLDTIKTTLAQNNENSKEKNTFLLSSDNHSVGMYLDVPSGKWRFFNINYLGERGYYLEATSLQLASIIFNSFSDHKEQNTVFSINCLSTHPNPTLVTSLQNMTRGLLNQASTTSVNTRGSNTFFLAATEGDIATFKILLNKGADVNTKNQDDCTPLLLAAQNGHLEIVQTLLAAPNIDVKTKSKKENTPLILAAQNGHLEIVQALLGTPVEVNAQNNNGISALMLAAKNGHLGVIQTLLANPGTKVNADAKDHDGNSALMLAAQNGHLEIVQALLAVPDINVHAQNKNGATALILAAAEGHVGVVSTLLSTAKLNPKLDSNVNAQDNNKQTALIWATENAKPEVVKELLKDPNIDLTIKDGMGYTALAIATEKATYSKDNSYSNIAKLIIEHAESADRIKAARTEALAVRAKEMTASDMPPQPSQSESPPKAGPSIRKQS